MIQRLGGRKVLITFLILIAGVVLDKFSANGLSNNMLTLLLGVIGSFTAGNLGTHLIQNKYEKAQKDIPKETENVAFKEVYEAVLGSRASVEQLKEAAMTNAQALNFLVQYVKSVQG